MISNVVKGIYDNNDGISGHVVEALALVWC